MSTLVITRCCCARRGSVALVFTGLKKASQFNGSNNFTFSGSKSFDLRIEAGKGTAGAGCRAADQASAAGARDSAYSTEYLDTSRSVDVVYLTVATLISPRRWCGTRAESARRGCARWRLARGRSADDVAIGPLSAVVRAGDRGAARAEADRVMPLEARDDDDAAAPGTSGGAARVTSPLVLRTQSGMSTHASMLASRSRWLGRRAMLAAVGFTLTPSLSPPLLPPSSVIPAAMACARLRERKLPKALAKDHLCVGVVRLLGVAAGRPSSFFVATA